MTKSIPPTPNFLPLPFTEHTYWPCCRKGPQGVVRPVVGPHSPFCGGQSPALPLPYTLKVVEPSSCRIVSATPMAGPEEAKAALKLLGPTDLQPVLVGRSSAFFLPRTSFQTLP